MVTDSVAPVSEKVDGQSPVAPIKQREPAPLTPRAYLINTGLLLCLMLVLGLLARANYPWSTRELLSWGNWPVLVICLGMIAAAVLDWWLFKVPNKLTFPLILSGWALGLLHSIDSWFNLELHLDAGTGGIWSSLGGTLWGFALLFLVLSIGGVGEGDVKMQMGFGAWVGAFFGFQQSDPSALGGMEGRAFAIIWWAFCAGVVAGGIIGAIMILVRRDFARNLEHTRAILTDMLAPTQARKRAEERRPRWHRLPYGVPLCIGFVGYLYLKYYDVWPTVIP
jgi:prepilin peptidase CpaA